MMATTPLTLPLYADYVLNIGKHAGDFIFTVVAPVLNGYLGLEQAYMVRLEGFEPSTNRLKVYCATTALQPQIDYNLIDYIYIISQIL